MFLSRMFNTVASSPPTIDIQIFAQRMSFETSTLETVTMPFAPLLKYGNKICPIKCWIKELTFSIRLEFFFGTVPGISLLISSVAWLLVFLQKIQARRLPQL